MKKNWLIVLLFVISFYSCSNNSENVDDVLCNTRWECEYLNRYPGGDINDGGFWESPLEEILRVVPDIKYSIEVKDVKQELDTVFHYDPKTLISISFNKSECVYKSEKHDSIEIKTYKNKTLYRVFTQGIYKGENGNLVCEIKEDGIYVTYLGNYVGCIKLNNFRNELKSKELSNTELKEIDNKQNCEIMFSYKRDDKEVIMENDSIRWIGTFDNSFSKLSVIQILPEEKDIDTFKLVLGK